ncbi:MAG: hypothetical protein Q9191_000546 [Dirinaria sp. TL-2023a]
MLNSITSWSTLTALLSIHRVIAVPLSQVPLAGGILAGTDRNISAELFTDLEELSRIVDISYCVGTTGIQKPFLCASRCQDFEGFELVTTWETGPLLSDSCGYLVIDHTPPHPRIIAAFRGTYSIANTIVDLSTIPQEYVPYPGGDGEDTKDSDLPGILLKPGRVFSRDVDPKKSECTNCTVHAGFMTSWRHTRPHVVPHLDELVKLYPNYQLSLVGHSLGGAVAALAALDFQARGWKPQVTTFGEPRIGNDRLTQYLDKAFPSNYQNGQSEMYRRVTHIDDPVPLLPLSEWGYRMHAGEVFISKPDLSPELEDLWFCNGDADPNCIAGGQSTHDEASGDTDMSVELDSLKDWLKAGKDFLTVPARFRIWQLFFAHRDYFWRLGLCVPYTDTEKRY